LDFVEKVGISTLHSLDLADETAVELPVDNRFPRTVIKSVLVEEVKSMAFWT
jgi:histidinol-phosphatase (PHP family)